MLPAQSVCLIVPIKKIAEHPEDAEDDAAGRRFGTTGTETEQA